MEVNEQLSRVSFANTSVPEQLAGPLIMSHVLAACKMPRPIQGLSLATAAAVPAHVTSTVAKKAKNETWRQKEGNLSRAVPSKAGAVCGETAVPVSSRDPGSSSLIQCSCYLSSTTQPIRLFVIWIVRKLDL